MSITNYIIDSKNKTWRSLWFHSKHIYHYKNEILIISIQIIKAVSHFTLICLVHKISLHNDPAAVSPNNIMLSVSL